MLMFESMNNQHIATSKPVKICLVCYVGSKALCIKEGGIVTVCRMSLGLKAVMQLRCSSLLLDIEKAFPVTIFRIAFSKVEVSLELNGLLTKDKFLGELKANKYKLIQTVYPFICGYADQATVNIEYISLTKVNTTFYELILESHLKSWEGKEAFQAWMPTLKRKVKDLKDRMAHFLRRPL